MYTSYLSSSFNREMGTDVKVAALYLVGLLPRIKMGRFLQVIGFTSGRIIPQVSVR